MTDTKPGAELSGVDKASLQERLRYRFDNSLSRGVVAMIGWLAVAMCFLIVVTSVIIWFSGIATESSLVEQIWAYLVRVLGGTTQPSWPFRLATLVIVLGGIFVMSSLISLLTTGFRNKLDELRKGRSRVLESDHTVILGWSEGIFTIISELLIANENQKSACIVILGDKDRLEMEDQIRERIGKSGRTRIICRTGSSAAMKDLDIVNVNAARAIVIVSEESGPSASAIKTILAIVKRPNRRREPYHIVANVHSLVDMQVAKIVGKDEVELLHTSSLIARIEAQTCRQSGLSLVYSELLDFDGDEIYFQSERELVGKTYGEAVLSYEDSAVIGIASQGSVEINPPRERIVQEGDEIIAVSEDDDTVELSERTDIEIGRETLRMDGTTESKPVKLVVLGWNSHAQLVVDDLASYLPSASMLTLVVESESEAAEIDRKTVEELGLSLFVRQGDITDRRILDELGLAAVDHVVVLSCTQYGPQDADSRTLVTLIHLRDIRERSNHPFTIVSEILDVRNRELLEADQADDFILSDRLVGLAMAQIAENKRLGPLLDELFRPEGSEIYFKPMKNYVTAGKPTSFFTISDTALARNETAIGYRKIADAKDAQSNFGIVVNPKKSACVNYEESDQIIVLAEH